MLAYYVTFVNHSSRQMEYIKKIQDIKKVEKIIRRLKSDGKKIVFTNGCFDLVHPGHIRYLYEAKNLGDFLVVAINDDCSVKRIKGPKRPIMSEKARAEIIASLGCVDVVLIFSEDTPENVIRLLIPDILVKGADWKEDEIVGADIVKDAGGKVITIPYVQGYSTSSIINRIIDRFCR